MAWMILNPRELDAVRDAGIRARSTDTDTPQRNMLVDITQPPYLQRDELDIYDNDMKLIEEWQRNWKSPYHAAFSAIVAANLRHG